MELIKITEHNGEQVVSARELHTFLEVGTDFTNWCKRMFDYGFEEGKDFTPIMAKSSGGRPSVDYALSLDTAKEISMLQRSEKGKQARQYFIQCEKAVLAIKAKALTPKELAQMVIDAENEKEKSQALLLEAESIISTNAPKVVFADSVSVSKDCILVKELAGYLCQNGIQIGQNRLFEWLRLHNYLCKKGDYYNLPTQKALEMKLFEVTERTINRTEGVITSFTPKVTGKGQLYFVNKFLGNQGQHFA